MDMHTDTTAHLAAEGTETPARAVADMAAALAAPSDLAGIIDAAEEYDAKFVQPANARHNAAEAAYIAKREDPALNEAEKKAQEEWDGHCDVYRSIVDTILDVQPTTPEQLLAQVDAWGALTAKHFAWRPGADTLIGKLCETDAIMIGEHMHASLKGISGASPAPACGPNTPPSFDAEVAAIVAEAKEIAKDIGPAQDDFNAVDDAWTRTKGEGEEELGIRRNELETVWWKHLDRFSEVVERLFDLPVSTTADKARIVRAYAELMAPVFGDTDLDNKLAGLPTENLLEVISYLDGTRPKALNGRDEIRQAWIRAKAAQDEKSAWETAKATFEAARESLKAARVARASAELAIDAAAPEPEILVIDRHEDGRVNRMYLAAESIERDFGKPEQRTVKGLMLNALGPWYQQWEAAKERFNLEALIDGEEAAFDAWRAAYRVIADLTPPDLGAMVYKASVLILDDCFNEEYDGPTQEQIQALLLDDGAKYAVAKVYQDIVALADQTPSTTVQPLELLAAE